MAPGAKEQEKVTKRLKQAELLRKVAPGAKEQDKDQNLLSKNFHYKSMTAGRERGKQGQTLSTGEERSG